jgi:hypothetical protein
MADPAGTGGVETDCWCGWFRLPRQRWRQVCAAATEAECWQLLLDVPGGNCEKTVLIAGETPGKKASQI